MRSLPARSKGRRKMKTFGTSVMLAGGLIGWALASPAWSQPYPQRPIRLIVQGVASSTPDIITRPIAQRVSQSVGQPIIVDNRPGAAGVVAAQTATSAPPDG